MKMLNVFEYFKVIPVIPSYILITSLGVNNFNLSYGEMFQVSTVNIVLITSYNIMKKIV